MKRLVMYLACMCLCANLSNADTMFEPVYINGDSSGFYDVEVDSIGDIYVSNYYHGVYKYSNMTWTQLNTISVGNLAFDNANHLWGSKRDKLWKYAENEWTLMPLNNLEYMISEIDASQENIVWVSTFETGVRKFDFNNNTRTTYSEREGLNDPWCNIIKTTSDGHVWVSHTTRGWCEFCVYKGVSHFNGDQWEIFTTDNGLIEEEVTSIVAFSANEAYIGSRSGIAKYNGETLEQFDVCDALRMAKGPDGALWAATWDVRPVYKKYLNGDVHTFDRHHSYPPRKIVVDKDETVWTIMNNRLYRTETKTPVSVENTTEPETVELAVHPNPFNNHATLSYLLPTESLVQLSLYNVIGQKVATIVDGHMPAGRYSEILDGTGFTSGLYFCLLKAGDRISVKKMTLLR